MKRKTIVAVLAFLCGISAVPAQSLGEFSPKEERGARGPRKFESKDVFISNFSVNFQVYNERTASTKGEFTGRSILGGTKASLAVGLNIPEETLQSITNHAYQQFVEDLKAKGFNVLNGDAAASTDYYKGYQRMESMEMSLSEAPGFVTVYPSGSVFFVKGFKQSGQKKQGGFFGAIGQRDQARRDELGRISKLSAELKDATIVDANLYVLFMNDEKGYQGRGANLSATTNLALTADEHVKSRVENTRNLPDFMKSSSKEVTYQCITSIDFIQGRNKIGGSPLGTYTGVLKKDLPVTGVIGKEKVSSYAEKDYDNIGTETVFGKVYRAENISVENTALIKADASKYQNGVEQALNKFLSHHLNEFKTKFFK